MERTRSTQRLLRRRGPVPSVAIAGYTNAGKSSVLNRLTGARVLVEDALFATLDPTVRRATTPDGRQYTLTDTVGFVRHLPHQLVEAFRSTLEEVTDADMVLHVVDASHADPLGQMEAVRVVLAEIGAADLPELVVLNKTDLADPEILAGLQRRMPEAVAVSARTGDGFDLLAEAIGRTLPLRGVRVDAIVPYHRGDLVADAHRLGEVHSVDHGERGTHLVATVPVHLAARITDLGGG
jgi:GTP-binding protein HflX